MPTPTLTGQEGPIAAGIPQNCRLRSALSPNSKGVSALSPNVRIKVLQFYWPESAS